MAVGKQCKKGIAPNGTHWVLYYGVGPDINTYIFRMRLGDDGTRIEIPVDDLGKVTKKFIENVEAELMEIDEGLWD